MLLVNLTSQRLRESLSGIRDDPDDLSEQLRRIDDATFARVLKTIGDSVGVTEQGEEEAEEEEEEDGEGGEAAPAAAQRRLKKNITTKHDIPITTRRNAKKLENVRFIKSIVVANVFRS